MKWKWIASEYTSERQAVLRYANWLSVPRESLYQSSIEEGFRLLPLRPYRGVELAVLDESTRMRTGTYKSLDGCVTAALCHSLGYRAIAFSSGSNTGTALTEYANRLGIRTFFFCPSTTLYKIRWELFENGLSHLISVEGTDRRVKESARCFSEKTGVPLVPSLEWRLLAAEVRGLFIAEQVLSDEKSFDWIVQAICAAFGPLGIYRCLQKLKENGECNGSFIPRFLGIQQSALSPIATAWRNRQSEILKPSQWKDESSIEPGLYNTCPDETYKLLFDTLNRTGGDVRSIDVEQFEKHKGAYIERLQEAGIELTVDPVKRDFIERAGLIAGAGMIEAIHSGKIAEGQRVICSLSGGTGPLPLKKAHPEWNIPAEANLDEELSKYFMQLNAVTEP
jgi:threonine synthase